jgi:hypothetical protein
VHGASNWSSATHQKDTTMKQRTFPETHRRGHISVENLDLVQQMNLLNADFGVQISSDGRVWVCVNGIAFVRFKPRAHESE